MFGLIGLIQGLSSKVLFGVILALLISLAVSAYMVKHYIERAAAAEHNLKQSEQVLKENRKKLSVALELNEILNESAVTNSQELMVAEKQYAASILTIKRLKDESGCLDTITNFNSGL